MVSLISGYRITGDTRAFGASLHTLLLFVCVISAGCDSTSTEPPGADETGSYAGQTNGGQLSPDLLAGHIWALEQVVSDSGNRSPNVLGTVFQLQFFESGVFSGQINCRELRGQYTINATGIRLIVADSSQPDCRIQPSPLLDRITNFLFNQSTSVEFLEDKILRISSPDGDLDLYGIELTDDSNPLIVQVLEAGDYLEFGRREYNGDLFPVFTNTEQFDTFYQSFYPDGPFAVVTPGVDFNQQVVVGAFMTVQPTGAARIDIQAVVGTSTKLHIYVLYDAIGCGSQTAPTGPYMLTLLQTRIDDIVVSTRVSDRPVCNK